MEQALNFANEWLKPFMFWLTLSIPIWLPMFVRPMVAAWVFRRSSEVLESLAEEIESAPIVDDGISPRHDDDLRVLVATLQAVSMTVCLGQETKLKAHEPKATQKTADDLMSRYKSAIERYDFAAKAVFSIMLIAKVGVWVSKPVVYIEGKRPRWFVRDWIESLGAYLAYYTLTDDTHSISTITSPSASRLDSVLERLPDGIAIAR